MNADKQGELKSYEYFSLNRSLSRKFLRNLLESFSISVRWRSDGKILADEKRLT